MGMSSDRALMRRWIIGVEGSRLGGNVRLAWIFRRQSRPIG